jgi:hypothetical protein
MQCITCGHEESEHHITGCEHRSDIKELKHGIKCQQRCQCPKFKKEEPKLDPRAANQLGNIPKRL